MNNENNNNNIGSNVNVNNNSCCRQQSRPDENRNRTPERPRTPRLPRADIYQCGDDVIIELDMPGVSRENVDIRVENNILTLIGKPDTIPAGWSPLRRELSRRDYERAFELGPDVDRENISAAMTNGVLKLTLPKAPSAKAHRIPVSA